MQRSVVAVILLVVFTRAMSLAYIAAWGSECPMVLVFVKDSTHYSQSCFFPIESALMQALYELGENRDFNTQNPIDLLHVLFDWDSGAVVDADRIVTEMEAAGVGVLFLVDVMDWRPSEAEWSFLDFPLVVPWLWHPLGFTYQTVATVNVPLFDTLGCVGNQSFTEEEGSTNPWLILASLFRFPAENDLETEARVQVLAGKLAWRILNWAVEKLLQPGMQASNS